MAPKTKTKRKAHEAIEVPSDNSEKENPSTSSKRPRANHLNNTNAHATSSPQSITQNGSQQCPQESPSQKNQNSSNAAVSNHPSSSSSNLVYYRSTPNVMHSYEERQAWLQDEDEDINEIVSGSQNVPEIENAQLYGEVGTRIVGVQYYRGLANPGEQILIRREPGNPYDSNAIRIDNVAGQQIGHIPRQLAMKLSTYIDNKLLIMEGRIIGQMNQFDCPLGVKLYGPDPSTEAGRDLTAKMAADKLPLKALIEAERARKQQEIERKKKEADRLKAQRIAAANGSGGRFPEIESTTMYKNQTQAGIDGSQAHFDVFEASERFDPRNVGQSAEHCGMQEEALQKLPFADQPKAIATQMLPYQLQALQWLLDHEDPKLPDPKSKNAVQLWTRAQHSDSIFINLATNFSTREAPVLARGGILADDMGLGKTLEMISLIVADTEKNGRGTTLVVSPLSVMSNWSGQIAHHVNKNSPLNVYIYHGSNRTHMKSDDFAKYDVVITTYQTLTSDFMPRGKSGSNNVPEKGLRTSGLYSVNWRRVILDEGHIVRNPQAKGSLAVRGLTAQCRWVLSGTPIVNSLRDLYSLLRFIGITGGLETMECFNTSLVRPLKSGNASAAALLQAIMAAFTLRRRKDMAFIDLRLPKLEEYIHTVTFSKKERERYDALLAEAKGLLTRYEKTAKGQSQAYSHLLTILLRMRQCCNHWQLCGERVTKLLEQLDSATLVDLTPQNVAALQDILQVQVESHEDCPVCLEPLHDPVITPCTHAFGFDCIARVIENQHKCPMCRAELKDDLCLTRPAKQGAEDSPDADLDLNASSTKVESLINILQQTRRSGKGDKTIVFSQWTSFLNIVQARLDREGFIYSRIDGTMRADDRDASLAALAHDDKCTILLASLGVCAVGLNLTAANQILMCDTWWAPAIEDQAVDRVHRLGQKKETRVFRLVMEDTIEQRTLEIQRDKRKLMMLAFSEKQSKRGNAKAGRLADIQKLLA